jgi:transcriptional regulator of acetoin/glycerol metabolism
VITTTRSPLFPLVERGAFLEGLYYHLSVVCLDVASSANRTDRRALETV